jgi:serine protease AprX
MTATWSLRTRVPLASIIVLTLALGLTGAFGQLETTTGSSAPSHAVVDPALVALRTGEAAVIIQKTSAADRAPETAVDRLGGRITRELPIVDGFAATVPVAALRTLAGHPGIRVISLDRKVMVAEGEGGGSPNSVYPKVVKSNTVNTSGITGTGVTVAIVDTGITEVADLAGRVTPIQNGGALGGTSPCKNFSGESSCNDSYGHGTFIAGIIAGNGAASAGGWKGIAPQAKVLSVKIAGASGAADVSNVLAGIQWVVSFKTQYNIKILNLSLGTNSTQTYRTDPMNYAVEKAWDAGIVVVVAASNLGPDPGTISKPGDDPWVVTVGAIDDHGTVGLGDDTIPNFSARGPTAADGVAKPDVAAPGGHVISLRAPGSEIDTQFPTYIDGAYRKGSGTSMATGVVSGTAALMLQANPGWSPNRVKYALTSTARNAASDNPMDVGAGMVDAFAATFSAPAGEANAGLDRSSGLGSLDASRGTVQFQADDTDQTIVNGVLTAQLMLWDPITYTGAPWTPLTWSVSQFAGGAWYGGAWYGGAWYGGAWYGGAWYGQPEGGAWYGGAWYGGAWYGGAWYGGAWYGAWE